MKRLILLLIVFFAGCNALSPYANRGGEGINSAGNVSTNGVTSTINANKKYLVEEKDVLVITVRDEPKLSVTSRVSENGEIWVPLLENVEVRGLTIQETEKFLENRFENGFLKDPKVTVRIDTQQMKEYSEKEVFVSGQVNKPGAIPLLGQYITVFEAVNQAGGLTNIAWPSRTKVIREENGVKSTIKVNLRKVKKGDTSQDIIVKPGDIIIVPETIF